MKLALSKSVWPRGTVMRDLRNSLGLTQEQLLERTDLYDLESIQNVEHVRPVSPKTIEKLTAALKIAGTNPPPTDALMISLDLAVQAIKERRKIRFVFTGDYPFIEGTFAGQSPSAYDSDPSLQNNKNLRGPILNVVTHWAEFLGVQLDFKKKRPRGCYEAITEYHADIALDLMLTPERFARQLTFPILLGFDQIVAVGLRRGIELKTIAVIDGSNGQEIIESMYAYSPERHLLVLPNLSTAFSSVQAGGADALIIEKSAWLAYSKVKRTKLIEVLDAPIYSGPIGFAIHRKLDELKEFLGNRRAEVAGAIAPLFQWPRPPT